MSMAEEIVDGEICAGCMMPFTKPHGYPVVCKECKKEGFNGYQKAIYEIDRGQSDKEEK